MIAELTALGFDVLFTGMGEGGLECQILHKGMLVGSADGHHSELGVIVEAAIEGGQHPDLVKLSIKCVADQGVFVRSDGWDEFKE